MVVARVIPLQEADPKVAEEAQAATRIAVGIRNGRPESETELVQRYSRGLRFLLARRLGDPDLAEDQLQETLAIAISKLREIDLENPERLAGYLRGIAIRVALNAGRRRQRDPFTMEVDAIGQIPDREPGQYDHVARNQTRTAVHRLLQSMPVKRDREILTRFYVQDEDKEDICLALGLDSLHFNRVLFRAKKRFRKLLEKSGSVADLAAGLDG